jgi:hypothetical protein
LPMANSSSIPKPPPEAGQIFDQLSNQVCGLDFSAFDPTGMSGQLTGPIAELQHVLVQTRFGTPRTVAGDDIRTLTNKCVLKPVDAADYAGAVSITDSAAFVAQVKEIFPQGVCDYSKPGVGTQATQTWLRYGTATEKLIGGTPLPVKPANSRQGWSASAFRNVNSQ